MSTPLVSVIIPAYRHEAYIADALDSILTQSVQDFEIIVVDDGSPDRTAAVAEDYACRDSRVRLIRQANGGSHAAINRGLRAAVGTWFAILNSDDRYHPKRLERLLDAAGGRYWFLVSDVRLIDQDGLPIDDAAHWWLAMFEGLRRYARRHGALAGLLFGNYTASTSNFFLHRDVFATLGGFRNYRYVVDWEYALRVALFAPERFCYLRDEALLDYRLHGENTILRGDLRSNLEVARMQQSVLTNDYQVTPGLLLAQRRNQRLLRRYWRALGMQTVETMVHERDSALAATSAQLNETHAALSKAHLALQAHQHERDSALAAASAQLNKTHAALSKAHLALQEHQTGLADAHLALQEHQTALQAHQTALADAHDSLRGAEDLVRDRDFALAAAHAKSQWLDQQLTDAMQRLTSIHNSRSWRYTRFFRRS